MTTNTSSITFTDAAELLGISMNSIRVRRRKNFIPEVITPALMREWATDLAITITPTEYAEQIGKTLPATYRDLRIGKIPSRTVAGKVRPLALGTISSAEVTAAVDDLILQPQPMDTPETIWERRGHLARTVLGLSGPISGIGSHVTRQRLIQSIERSAK